ncbi:MAG: AtpZ/AtpI family protein [Gammaproteobacteria bacterium]
MSAPVPPDHEVGPRVERQARRMQQAERDRPTLAAQTLFLGTLGVAFIAPVILCAYLGRWIDGFVAGYSIRWTLSLLFLGIVVGAVNVYLLIRERP